MPVTTEFQTAQAFVGKRTELAAGESVTYLFDRQAIDWVRGVSTVINLGEGDEVTVEHKLDPGDEDWTPDPDSPFDLSLIHI